MGGSETRRTPSRARLAGASAGLLAAALAGCSLVLQFDEGKLTGSGGSGGAGTSSDGGGGSAVSAGGMTASSGGTTASSGTSSDTGTTTDTATGTGGLGGGPMGPIVACNYPDVADCLPGQVCCLDLTDPYMDFCVQPGQCNPPSQYGELACDGPEDCPGQVCCLYYSGAPIQVHATYCKDACDPANNEIAWCADTADCQAGDVCIEILGGNYPSYTFCAPG